MKLDFEKLRLDFIRETGKDLWHEQYFAEKFLQYVEHRLTGRKFVYTMKDGTTRERYDFDDLDAYRETEKEHGPIKSWTEKIETRYLVQEL